MDIQDDRSARFRSCYSKLRGIVGRTDHQDGGFTFDMGITFRITSESSITQNVFDYENIGDFVKDMSMLDDSVKDLTDLAHRILGGGGIDTSGSFSVEMVNPEK